MPNQLIPATVARLAGARRTLGGDASAARRDRRAAGTSAPHRCVPFALALALALPFAFDFHSAMAYRGWCRADPQFLIGGQLALVEVQANVPNMSAARALSSGEPIGLVLTVPRGIDAEHLASGDGFGSGYAVIIEHSPALRVVDGLVSVIVAVYVPMTDPSVAVRVSFTPAEGDRLAKTADAGELDGRALLSPGAASGTVNAWIYVLT